MQSGRRVIAWCGGRDRARRARVLDGQICAERRQHQKRLRSCDPQDQRQRWCQHRRPAVPARGPLLRRRIDSGARHRTRRAAGEAGRRQIHAWALRLGPDQGDPAGHREIQGADGRGEWLRPRAVHQGLSLRVRRALPLGPISYARHRPCRRARRRSRQDQGQAQSRTRHGKRSVCAGRARGRLRRRATPRHDGGDRRPAAGRARRHVGDAEQGEGLEARRARDLGSREGRAHRRSARSRRYTSMCRSWP